MTSFCRNHSIQNIEKDTIPRMSLWRSRIGAPSEPLTRLLAIAQAGTISYKTKFLANHLSQEPTELLRRLVLNVLMLGWEDVWERCWTLGLRKMATFRRNVADSG